MEEKAVDEALLRLLREGVENWQILYGVALGLSASGRSRVEIMRFFWDFMVGHEGELSERQMDLVGDFCHDLLGRGPIEHIVRLIGDPDDPHELARKVAEEARAWKAPS